MEGAKAKSTSNPKMRPLIKTEGGGGGNGENDQPNIIVKQIPYNATKLAKLQEKYSRQARESKTEYVWSFFD